MSCASAQALFRQESSCLSCRGMHHPQRFLTCCYCLSTLTVLHKPRGTFQLQPPRGSLKSKTRYRWVNRLSHMVNVRKSYVQMGSRHEQKKRSSRLENSRFFLFSKSHCTDGWDANTGDVCSLLSYICIFFREAKRQFQRRGLMGRGVVEWRGLPRTRG